METNAQPKTKGQILHLQHYGQSYCVGHGHRQHLTTCCHYWLGLAAISPCVSVFEDFEPVKSFVSKTIDATRRLIKDEEGDCDREIAFKTLD